MRRGTKPKSREKIPDPIGERIKELRIARGMSLQALAERLGIAPSHVFHVENGDKVPSEELAVEIARALHEDEDLYRAWARARSRSDFYTAVESAEVLAQYLRGARSPLLAEVMGSERAAALEKRWERPQVATESESRPPSARLMSFLHATMAPRPARLLVPLLPAGADPGQETISPQGLDVIRLDPRALDQSEPLERPFAYALDRPTTSRVQGLLPDRGVAILTRRVLPVVAHEIYAVRHAGLIVLSRAMWNGRELMLLPAPGASDFVVLPAADEAAVTALIAGRVALVHTEP
jgi:transcriptional regulator with XRE-family HTH domain